MRRNALTAEVKSPFISLKAKKLKCKQNSSITNQEMIKSWIGYAIIVIVRNREILFSFVIAVTLMLVILSAMKH